MCVYLWLCVWERKKEGYCVCMCIYKNRENVFSFLTIRLMFLLPLRRTVLPPPPFDLLISQLLKSKIKKTKRETTREMRKTEWDRECAQCADLNNNGCASVYRIRPQRWLPHIIVVCITRYYGTTTTWFVLWYSSLRSIQLISVCLHSVWLCDVGATQK